MSHAETVFNAFENPTVYKCVDEDCAYTFVGEENDDLSCPSCFGDVEEVYD